MAKTLSRTYFLPAFYFVVRDAPKFTPRQESIMFQAENGTYFGNLSSVMSLLYTHLLKAGLERRTAGKMVLQFLKNNQEDLVFMQRNYQIIKKSNQLNPPKN